MRETPRTAIRYSFALVQAVKSRMDMGTIRREDSHMTDSREPSETLRPASSQRLTAQWICGFVDGEGNFFVDINPHQEMTSGFQVLPEFTVVQHERDVQLLYALKKFFRCGVVRQDHGDHMCYRVRSVEHLMERITTVLREARTAFQEACGLHQVSTHIVAHGARVTPHDGGHRRDPRHHRTKEHRMSEEKVRPLWKQSGMNRAKFLVG